MAVEFARLPEDIRLEEEEERRLREEKKIKAEEKWRAAAEQKREEEQKQQDIEETRRRVRELTSLAHAGTSMVTSQSSTSEGPEKSCSSCMERKRDCTWTQASRSNRVSMLWFFLWSILIGGPVDPELQCVPPAEGTVFQGKKCQRSLAEMDDNVELISNPQTVITEEGGWTEYDDQAWVAAANDIVAALAQTNRLLERSIAVAEGSRAAMDRFVEEELDEVEEEVEGASGAGISGGDMETDDL
ncbi:uncharacterized protein EDB91DRAFT_1257092 [Suillus paluster]|uniref:uncharacterized protein n=1 Tax=Suillus paluster TaxID=48578 RepID=UPI001B885AC9|nr:uncharacterized protein EDB91DRAFT_1257092 [Suillus paluster]KAG1720198.1 hypothetical protein EDB91DRAFT_1257092 [Suillus paluster]